MPDFPLWTGGLGHFIQYQQRNIWVEDGLNLLNTICMFKAILQFWPLRERLSRWLFFN